MPLILPLLLIPDPGPHIAGPHENGDDVAGTHQKSEAILRGARMLRTALGPAIARFLEDPAIVEAMLNPDGRLWVDRLSGGLSRSEEHPSELQSLMRLYSALFC